ncbi:MAG TPA: aldo/keto reductase [Anaerolineales bacterium]|nr:aldo/keto reductase [Anaerolineales bacterium]
MLKRTRGKSKLEVSALGMGCWAIGGPWTWDQPGGEPFPAGWGATDDDESIRAVHAALDMGVNFFDTAANYGAGHSEVVLGRALKGKRDAVVIATKFGHIVNEEKKVVYGDPDLIIKNVRTDVENSLRRLQTETIDIYQLHEGGYDPKLALELQVILEELVSAGKIRWYGWSTDTVDSAREFASGAHCTSIQFRLNAIFDNAEMRKVCADFDLAGINKDPLNKGILTGKFSSTSKFPPNDIRSRADFSDPEIVKRLKLVDEVRDIFTSGGRTMAQGALAYIWALDGRMVPIPGFKSVQQVQENAGALELGPLTESQVKEIQAVVGKYELKG